MSYGSHPSISTASGQSIQIMGKAEIYPCCCNVGAAPRTYLYVLENGLEKNSPMALLCIPPNCVCPGTDLVSKTYFDRGPWDKQGCSWKIGCVSGVPTFYANSRKKVFCCVDCCECYNDWSDGHIPACCGDKIVYSPFDTCYCCCPNKVGWCCNCFGLCGLKTGEPFCVLPYYECLLPGSGEQLAERINNSRAAWAARTGQE